MMFILLFSLIAISDSLSNITASPPNVYMCDETNTNNSYIYCYGQLLQLVNQFNLFNDSKYFVDMPLKYEPSYVSQQFAIFSSNINNVNKDNLRQFVDSHFDPPGTELIDCTPIDWQSNPPNLMTITDVTLRQWAIELNAIWKQLCKQINTTVKAQPQLHSSIYIPHQFIVPGGRYREIYYWDSYWIIKGLIASNMFNSVRSIILNLAYMIDKYGFVPNGGRIYYLQRSQPPLLTAMLYEYYEKSNDIDFVRRLLPTIDREMYFWHNNRTIGLAIGNSSTKQTVYRYCSRSNTPRPESYLDDIHSAANVTVNQRPRFWKNVASGAESGWDFSSRWFIDHRNLQTIDTCDILPVDLNAFICGNAAMLEFMNERAGNFIKSAQYRKQHEQMVDMLDAVFYNATLGSWFDYSLQLRRQNTAYYLSMAAPLFTGCYRQLDEQISQRLYRAMGLFGALKYPGGVPTSLIYGTAQQWDFPDAWSPLNHMLIEGLRKSINPKMQDMAFQLAKEWVSSNYRVWVATGDHMWEKYDVNTTETQPGLGGEYVVQTGFGWSNGVILDLLTTYNDRMTLTQTSTAANNQALVRSSATITTIIYIYLVFFVSCIIVL